MRVLVTGGAGFIGSRLVKKLSDAGHDVISLDKTVDETHEYKPTNPAPNQSPTVLVLDKSDEISAKDGDGDGSFEYLCETKSLMSWHVGNQYEGEFKELYHLVLD